MSKPSKRRWPPRFSLRTLLLFYLLVSSGGAWVAHSYSEYLAEQGLIESLTTRLPPGSLMTVIANGETTRLLGRPLM